VCSIKKEAETSIKQGPKPALEGAENSWQKAAMK